MALLSVDEGLTINVIYRRSKGKYSVYHLYSVKVFRCTVDKTVTDEKILRTLT
jgi:hypothetical protein